MDRCIVCSGVLPPLNGVEENDFADLCEYCKDEQNELNTPSTQESGND